jgi:carbon storage regulator
MLVLSRKPGERILIGDDVAVTIVRIGPNTVRLGIDAPRDMNIVREELCQRDQGHDLRVEQAATAPADH